MGKHLKDRLRKLFQLEYELLLYDITSTHFEGEWRWQRPSPQRLFAGPAAKSQLKRFEKELLTKDWQEIREGLEVKRCASPEGEKSFILCRSKARAAKEKAIHERFEQRIEKRLEKLVAVCQAKKHKVGLIERWVGWILGANGRAAGLFKVAVSKREDGGASVKWQKVEEWRQ